MPPPATTSPPWHPTGPPVATVRFRWWTQVVAVVVMGTILAGLVIAVANAVSTGDADAPFRDSGITGGGVVAGWVVVAVIGGLLLMSIPLLLRFRLQVWPDGYVARAYVRLYPLGLDQLTGIQVVSRRQNPLSPVPATPVLVVTARDATGRRRGFRLTRSFQQLDPVLPTVDAWVRARPELVTGPARELFVARGVLAPEPRAATPATPPSFRQLPRP